MRFRIPSGNRPIKTVSVPVIDLSYKVMFDASRVFACPGAVNRAEGESLEGLLRSAVDLVAAVPPSCPVACGHIQVPGTCVCHECEARHLAKEARWIWTEQSHPLRAPPAGLPLQERTLDNFLKGGCGDNVLDMLLALQDGLVSKVVPMTGWVILPVPAHHRLHGSDWTHLVWEHCWALTRAGLLLDPSLGVCGVSRGWAYCGTEHTTFVGKDEGGHPCNVMVRSPSFRAF